MPWIGSNTEAPTQKHTYEAMAITGDNLLIMPDYKGFGISRELVQPYCNHELCAQNSIDAMKAGYKIFLDTSGAAMENNWKLYVIGAHDQRLVKNEYRQIVIACRQSVMQQTVGTLVA